jgi:hypothetical protein
MTRGSEERTFGLADGTFGAQEESMKKILNLRFKTIVFLAIALMLLGLWDLTGTWVRQPISLTFSGLSREYGLNTRLGFLNASFPLMLFSGAFVHGGFSFKRPRGNELFLRAYREAHRDMHMQTTLILWITVLGLFVMLGGLMLGRYWQSGLYLLYVIGSLIYLYGLWHQANLSDHLAQNRSNENQP